MNINENVVQTFVKRDPRDFSVLVLTKVWDRKATTLYRGLQKAYEMDARYGFVSQRAEKTKS
jgi:hypothetical protein